MTAIAVLAGVSEAWADDLPPVPKTIPVTVSAIVAPKVEPASTPKVEQPSCSAAEAPLPPTPAKAEAVSGKLPRHPVQMVIVFLGNQLLRKPIYDVQKTLNDLEGRRLCREDHHLAAETKGLPVEQPKSPRKPNTLAPAIFTPSCAVAGGKRMPEKANELAVKRASLECKQADHQQRTEKLKAKHAELFGHD